ncbi:MAG: DUF2029 domain-containing protein [Phycisphaerales bacterium]|nr:DUF2029 domain-containing protein [Phycisphaerales bacterium]
MNRRSPPALLGTTAIQHNAVGGRVLRWILTAIVCAAPFAMSLRKLALANQDFQIGIDFRMTYTAARTWRLRQDPYDDATLKAVWSASGAPHMTPPGRPQTPNVYPLSIAPLLAPLSWLPFPPAFAIWLLINAAAAGWIAWLIATSDAPRRERGAGEDPDRTATPWFLPAAAACIVVFGFPLHYGLVVSNLAVTTTLCVLLTLRHRDDAPALAGLLFGLALVKYTLCAPLALIFAIERRWRLLGVAGVTQLALLVLATLGYAGDSPFGWIPRMLAECRASLEPGAVNDYASLDYTALHTELAALLYRLAPILADARHVILAALGVVTLLACRRASIGRNAAASADMRYIVVLALTMIAVYHRVYDLIVVVAPLTVWLIRYRQSIPFNHSAWLWFAAAFSMYAGPTIAGGSANAPWTVLAFVQPNAIWATLIILLAGIAAMRSLAPRRDPIGDGV